MRFAFLNVLILGLLASGCSTPHRDISGSTRSASVIIGHRSPEQIDASIHKIFARHGYEAKYRDHNLMFDRRGSLWDAILFGEWYGGGVWERILVFQREVEPGRALVDCDAFIVQEPEDPFFQSVHPVYRHNKCQKLLDEAGEDLRKAPPTAVTAQ
jgi:hypothetical protein